MRKEIDRRTAVMGNSKADTVLVVLGVVIGIAGAAIALPIVAPLVPTIWGAGVAFAGLSTSIAGAARAEVNKENAEQLLQRSRDLTQLQRAIINAE